VGECQSKIDTPQVTISLSFDSLF